MTKEDKKRLALFGGVILVAVVLWLLLRGKTLNNIFQQGGSLNLPGAATLPGLAGLPAVSVDFGDHSYVGGSKGCNLCYSGYARLETPTPAPPYIPPPVEAIQRYTIQKTAGSWGSMTSGPPSPTVPIFSMTGIYMGQGTHY